MHKEAKKAVYKMVSDDSHLLIILMALFKYCPSVWVGPSDSL